MSYLFSPPPVKPKPIKPNPVKAAVPNKKHGSTAKKLEEISEQKSYFD